MMGWTLFITFGSPKSSSPKVHHGSSAHPSGWWTRGSSWWILMKRWTFISIHHFFVTFFPMIDSQIGNERSCYWSRIRNGRIPDKERALVMCSGVQHTVNMIDFQVGNERSWYCSRIRNGRFLKKKRALIMRSGETNHQKWSIFKKETSPRLTKKRAAKKVHHPLPLLFITMLFDFNECFFEKNHNN